MKSQIVISATAAALWVCSAAAQTPAVPVTPPASTPPRTSTDRIREADRTLHQSAQPDRLGKVYKASELIGMEVRTPADEDLGKVTELAVDLQSGRVLHVIVSSGGFLGIGDELSAVPPGAFRYDAVDEVLHLNTTKEALQAAPHFKAGAWPNLGDPAYIGSVYRSYGLEPYHGDAAKRTLPANQDRAGNPDYLGTVRDSVKDADNTGRNVRDRGDATLTPFDQGSSEADINAVRTIRKAILAQEGLSVNARNVKVIVRDGRVTLRGPVNSADEKRRIADVAGQTVQPQNVVNQLEVKRDTDND